MHTTNESELLTHTKQGAVLSRYFIALAMRTNSVLTPCKQGAVLSRYSLGLGNEVPVEIRSRSDR